MKKQIKNVISYIIIIILVLYIGINLLLPSKTVDVFGFRTFIVVSSSMAPDIMVNDMILVTKAKDSDLEAGDAITFKAYIPELSDYSFVTHYIASVEVDDFGKTIYKTHGANKANDDVDNWKDPSGNPVDISIEDVEGEYQFTVPLIGSIIYRLQDPIFLGLIIVNGIIIFAVIKVLKSPNKTKKVEAENEEIKKEIE